MEEDIKILEEHLEWMKEANLELDAWEKEVPALENLLTRYKQLEENNKNKTLKNIEYEKTLEKLQKETIWKSKIKEILDKNCVTFFEGDAEFPDNASRIIAKKYVKAEALQDLIGKE